MHLLMGVFDLVYFCGLKWLWAELVMGRNGYFEPGDLGAGSLLYKGQLS